MSFLDDLGVEEPLPVYGSLEELEADIAASNKKLAKLGDELGKALRKEARRKDWITGGDGIPPVDEDEDVNEATEAAKVVLENLKVFLEKFSDRKASASLYAKIKEVMNDFENDAETEEL